MTGGADHPHARGENVWKFIQMVSKSGPSPRAWGEPNNTLFRTTNVRTIPTRVGRTQCRCTECPCCTDHPHARGENDDLAHHPVIRCGPSPRAWGERPRGLLLSLDLRTIPTRVGRTARQTACQSAPADHPHARGENGCRSGRSATADGPSPRAWGELDTKGE